jgi:hypothetical protein
MENNDLQNNTQKTKDRAKRTPPTVAGKVRCSTKYNIFYKFAQYDTELRTFLRYPIFIANKARV